MDWRRSRLRRSRETLDVAAHQALAHGLRRLHYDDGTHNNMTLDNGR